MADPKTPLRLAGCRALITGVSRAGAIGAAVADRLRGEGAAVFTTGWPENDMLPQGPGEPPSIDLPMDLSKPDAPPVLFDVAVKAIGNLTSLIVVHTVDTGGGLLEIDADRIDHHLAVNVRATLLLMQQFAKRFVGVPGGGRIVLFTSKPPQLGAIAYAASKGAVEWITLSAATELGPRGITVNAIDPGPNQTGWMNEQIEREAAGRTPLGRVGAPTDAAARSRVADRGVNPGPP